MAIDLYLYKDFCLDTIGHHACKKDGGKEFVLTNAPFLSPNTGKVPFLGVGYYFWDFDLDQAKKWGHDHYRDEFYIISADLHLPEDALLDLAGNRQQMVWFSALLKRFERKGLKAGEWKLGEFIEFMREFRKVTYAAFPFEIIRAQDFLPQNINFSIHFNELPNYTNLNPRFVICFFQKNEVYLQNKRVIFES